MLSLKLDKELFFLVTETRTLGISREQPNCDFYRLLPGNYIVEDITEDNEVFYHLEGQPSDDDFFPLEDFKLLVNYLNTENKVLSEAY